ncbi:MAG TPA: YdiU family protein [Variovorax sp.]|nr:YdiU family protein [Variovorax sp.]
MSLLAADEAELAVDLGLRWEAGFHSLGPAFYTELLPRPLPDPYWVGRSPAMARQLGLGEHQLDTPEALEAFTGNVRIAGTRPLASVYSGHQFGVWAGQLGDGRAILLGEANGLEVQLKGSGLTPYSRMGDGRAVLRSSIREFLCSEAVHALGIPTTRALCVTGSDAPVYREEIETSAVVTRVAPSFIRFGHFEHFAANGQHEELRALADYVIERYYPACRGTTKFGGNAHAALLEAVSERTAALLAQWQAAGFCHGVMNTDNMSILGLTIDYGPFQFLDGFDPRHICNHSDTAGRYAYNQQPNVAYWNLFCLAQALLPLIGDQQVAVAALESYKTVFPSEFTARMATKLGLAKADEGDRALIDGLLRLLAAEKVDWTIFWRRLSQHVAGESAELVRELFIDRAAIDDWLPAYAIRRSQDNAEGAADRMLRANPKFVLRNHLGQLAIDAARQKDFTGVARLQVLLEAPFEEHPGHEELAGFPPDWASSIEISCSS